MNRRFDPSNLGRYAVAPPLLHLEFGSEGRVYRYVMVESFAAGVLDPDRRRTPAETRRGETHEQIRERILGR